MRFSTASTALFAVGAVAVPQNGWTSTPSASPASSPTDSSSPIQSSGSNATAPAQCLTAQEAQRVVGNFATLVSNFNEQLATSALSEDYEEISDSIIALQTKGCGTGGAAPYGGVAINGRQTFIDLFRNEGFPYQPLQIWVDCCSVTARWVSQTPNTNGEGSPPAQQQPVHGLSLMEVVPGQEGQEPWVIQKNYIEFNSVAWLYDLGEFTPANCSAGTQRRSLLASR